MYSSAAAPSSSWRDHVQDQEEELVRELMQADDVDAVLARMEGDHFRHLSPVMRKLNAFDGSAPPQPNTNAARSPRSPALPGQRPPPPPPPPMTSSSATSAAAPTNTADARPYSARRRLSGNLESRDEPQQQQQQPSAVPHHVPAYGRRSSYHHHDSASSSSYQPHHHDSDPGDFSPAARPPPPPPPPPLMSDYAAAFPERDPLDAYRRPATAATAAPPRRELEIHEPFDAEAESRYHATMDSWLKPDRNPPFDLTRDSPHSSAQRTNPFTATRPPTYAAVESSAISVDGMLPPPTPGSPWTSSGGRYHGHASADQQYDTRGAENARGAPRVTTTTTSPRRSEIGELENASQSRIARQLQLLRNYRELAELCSNTRDPSVDLFQSLPSEELARMQAEQLQQLPRREQSPITVNNNYYFDGSGSRRGSGGGGGGRSGHSPGRSGRGRVNSSDTVGALSKTGAGGAGGAGNGGQSRSVSELFTVDSHHGMTSHHPSGASSSQPPRPPLLPSPRVIPLQSPQPSSGPDSPVATPPLSQRGMGGGASITAGTSGVLAPPLAPPSPSRSYRARSHRSRVHDAHYTPTATTEEAGSSYDEDNVDEDDYAGDFMDNDVDGEDVEDDPYGGDEYDDATAPRPPPPRIIEREQHRRFPNAAGNGDYTTSGGQPPLSPNSSLQQQQQQQQQFPQQQQMQQQMQMQNNSYPGDYVTSASGNATNDLPGNGLPGTNAPSGTSRNMSSNNHNSTGISGGGVAGSDGGRRSVSSAINVLSGDQELRANAQLGASGMVDSRRGSHSQNMPPTQQQQQQERITAFNGNSSQPLPNFSQRPQQKRRSLSAGSSPPQRRRDAGAYTDPGMNSFSGDLSMSDMRPYDRRGSNGTPEKRMGGASNGSTGGYNGNRHRGSHANNNSSSRRAEVMGSRRQDTRRGGRGRNYGGNERRRDLNSDGDSTYSNEDDDENVDRDSYDNDYTVTEGDTPGNPQLQTHNPRSSAMRKKQQQQQQQHGNARGNVGGRPLMNTAGGRGRQRDGAADDGTVHTPRHQNVASRRRRDDRNGRRNGPSQQQQQQREDARRRGRRGSGATPSSPYYDDNGVEVNSASSYSYSYTTSSDISDYIAGSYYSPIKEQLPGGGRGAGAGGGGGGAVRSPMRGRGRGNPSPTTTPTRASGPMRPGGYPDRGGGAGSGGQGYGPTTSPNSAARNSPQRGRGRGVGGRGRGMNPSNVMGGGGGGGPSNAYYNSAVPANAPYGRGRGGAGGVMAGPQSANRRAAPPGSALGELDGRGSNLAFGSAPQRQQTQLPSGSHTTLQGGGPAGGTGMRSPRRSGNLFPTAEGGASVEAAATNVRPNAFVQLPDGRAVPANSPAGRQVRQMQQQQQQQQQARMRQQQLLMHQRQQQMQGGGQRAGPMPNIAATAAAPVQPSVQPFGYSPSGGFYPVGTTAVSRPVSPQRPQQQQQQQPVATTPMRNRRAASPSAAPSTSPAGRSTTSAAGAVHIHPGLLYGSLLPKARPKTALVVEDDERGREHSVAPHGDTTHEPFMDRGSVCPVQPTVVNFVPARTNFAGPPQPQPLDTFPVSSAIHGTTADGVQPLAWKSGGAGCVVSRSGHLPPAPDTKLSSHYRNPATSPSQQQQYAPAARTGVMSGAASSVGGNTFVSGNAPQRGQSVVGIMQTPQHFNALRPTAAGGRRDSAFSLQSDAAATAQQQQHQSAVVAAGANSSQQRYVPLQEPLEQPRGANYGRRRSSPAVVDPYSSAGRTAANRSANIQRFGIAPLQG